MVETHIGKVSAIMPTYNRNGFLHRAISQVQEQIYENWELIIVDDGSTDNTTDIVSRAMERDYRIKYVPLHKNSGCVTIPRAIGILHSKGEFIAHCDDDVIQFPQKFLILTDALNQNPDTDLAYGYRRAERLHAPGTYDVVGPEDYNPTVTWGVDGSQFIYRSNVYRHIPLSFCKRGCDWELMKLIWANSPGFTMVNSLVSQYNWHGSNRSLDDIGTKSRTYHPNEYRSWFDTMGKNFTYDLSDF